MKQRRAVIIGGGPAGLTAAVELLRRTGIQPIVLEASQEIGGISRTVKYKGNRMDIGGHRFFSKSDRVMRWWLDMMPIEGESRGALDIHYQGRTHTVETSPSAPYAHRDDNVMLVRERKSRIYYLRKFFDYPIKLSIDTLCKLGFVRTVRCGVSYMRWALLHRR